MMSELFGEFLGTLILILLGNGVVAGVVLPKTKSNSAGWIVITMGWGIAVAVAVFVSGKLSPAHLNPAVTVGVALKGDLHWASVLPYILAQFAGAMLGQILVWLQFKPHYEVEENAGNILATFSTGPAIKDTVSNLIPNFKLKLATQKKFTWRLVVQAFFRVVVNPIFDKSYFFRSRFLGSFR
ncbi:glycerol uptake facilitator protein [Streptococcus pneumoniae]|nr:glycerol uptake facilitator protein [Streptococcus pneumoniae]